MIYLEVVPTEYFSEFIEKEQKEEDVINDKFNDKSKFPASLDETTINRRNVSRLGVPTNLIIKVESFFRSCLDTLTTPAKQDIDAWETNMRMALKEIRQHTNITDQEIEETIVYLRNHLDLHLLQAETYNQTILFRACPEKGLHRSIIIDPDNNVFFLLNREGDQKFEGASKKICRSIHLNTGRILASTNMTKGSSHSQRSSRNDYEYFPEKDNQKFLKEHGLGARDGFLLFDETNLKYSKTYHESVTVDKIRQFSTFADQGDLKNYLKSEGISYTEKQNIFAQVVSAVDAMHKQGIFHRDLKPENILLHNKKAYLVDFSTSGTLGKRGVSPYTAKEFVGTESYLAPEINGVNKGKNVASRHNAEADIWALGLVALELFYKDSPIFFSDAFTKIVSAKDREKFFENLQVFLAELSKSNPDDPYLPLIRAMLDPDPNKRISANELMHELENIEIKKS